jgi:hypothetical protein
MEATNNGAAIKATFKGLNFLRYITRPLKAPATKLIPSSTISPRWGWSWNSRTTRTEEALKAWSTQARNWPPRAPGMPPWPLTLWPLTLRIILMSGSEPTMSRRPRVDRFRHGGARRTTLCGAQAITIRYASSIRQQILEFAKGAGAILLRDHDERDLGRAWISLPELVRHRSDVDRRQHQCHDRHLVDGPERRRHRASHHR